jgi:transposase
MTTKGTKYTCAKNPYVLPTRLTWTSATCLSTQREYLDYLSQEEDLKGMAVGLAGASLDEANKLIKEVADLNVQIQARLKNVICKRGK